MSASSSTTSTTPLRVPACSGGSVSGPAAGGVSTRWRGSSMRTSVPWPGRDSMRTLPPDWCAKPYTIDRPRPVPCPIGLVVKNGSNARATTSGAMPAPLSRTLTCTYSPGRRSPWRRACAGLRVAFSVSMTSRPPSGIASRALFARFSKALSSWFGSHNVVHSADCKRVRTAIDGPAARSIRSVIDITSALTLVGFGSSAWRRENASSRCVRAAARCVTPSAASMRADRSPVWPMRRRSFISSR